MIAGLGKNGQIVSISRGKGVVIIRMGNQPGSTASEVPWQFCDQIWEKLNEAMCSSSAVEKIETGLTGLQLYPNPARQLFTVELPQHCFSIAVYDVMGRIMFEKDAVTDKLEIDSRNFPGGVYFVQVTTRENIVFNKKLIILERKP